MSDSAASGYDTAKLTDRELEDELVRRPGKSAGYIAALRAERERRSAASGREPILIRCEGGWANGDYDHWFTPYQDEIRPGRQSGTYFKSVRTTDDGREIWTYGRVDDETLAAGYVAS